MTETKRGNGKALRRTAIMVVALAVVFEISLRFVGLGSPVLFVVDPKFGSFPKANQQLRRFFVDIKTNAFGMRSRPVSYAKLNGEYRILFVGDSVPFGTTYVDQMDIFPERIAAILNTNYKDSVTVLNASSPGWAPSNELGFIQARGIYGADMVVLVYNTKDLTQDFAAYRESPMTPIVNPSSATGELWSRYIQPRIFRPGTMVDPGSLTPEGRPSIADEARVMETIKATEQYVASHRAKFVILFSPAMTADVEKYRADWDRALLNLKNWAAEQGVPFLDMSKVMAAQSTALVYFDGIHLRQLGDGLVADAFVRWFEENKQ